MAKKHEDLDYGRIVVFHGRQTEQVVRHKHQAVKEAVEMRH